jgi:hypothetical protein
MLPKMLWKLPQDLEGPAGSGGIKLDIIVDENKVIA